LVIENKLFNKPKEPDLKERPQLGLTKFPSLEEPTSSSKERV